ncbi:MAG: transcriptional regulator NrdR [Patescibacteria group bacterium]
MQPFIYFLDLFVRCAVCNHKDTKVIDSRISIDGVSVRRRRECEKCGFRFSTLEEIELLDLTVVKRDGRRENYSKDKLVRGLEKALEKRPYTDATFQKLVHKIERDIQKKRRGQLTTAELGDIVMKHLHVFDKVAYIRFASVYRSFEDVRTFESELKKLLGDPKMPTRRKTPKKSVGKS